jgi:uncharacterized protein RhaS with RHS repeats
MDFSSLPFTSIDTVAFQDGTTKTLLWFDGRRQLIVTESNDSTDVTFSYWLNGKMLAESRISAEDLIARMTEHFSSVLK